MGVTAQSPAFLARLPIWARVTNQSRNTITCGVVDSKKQIGTWMTDIRDLTSQASHDLRVMALREC